MHTWANDFIFHFIVHIRCVCVCVSVSVYCQYDMHLHSERRAWEHPKIAYIVKFASNQNGNTSKQSRKMGFRMTDSKKYFFSYWIAIQIVHFRIPFLQRLFLSFYQTHVDKNSVIQHWKMRKQKKRNITKHGYLSIIGKDGDTIYFPEILKFQLTFCGNSICIWPWTSVGSAIWKQKRDRFYA